MPKYKIVVEDIQTTMKSKIIEAESKEAALMYAGDDNWDLWPEDTDIDCSSYYDLRDDLSYELEEKKKTKKKASKKNKKK